MNSGKKREREKELAGQSHRIHSLLSLCREMHIKVSNTFTLNFSKHNNALILSSRTAINPIESQSNTSFPPSSSLSRRVLFD
jgi:hypothetical protein